MCIRDRYYLTRYKGVPVWHQQAENILRSSGKLLSASGHTREFFGRRFGKDITDTVKKFLADEPQNNTTWVTNLALHKLWNSKANRIVKREGHVLTCADGSLHLIPLDQLSNMYRLIPGALLIEPLHTIHDALAGQWPTFLRNWATKQIQLTFDNQITIAKTTLKIPFEGGYGPSWEGTKQNAI